MRWMQFIVVLCRTQRKLPLLTPDEFSIISEILQRLKLFADLNNIFSAETGTTISLIIPTVDDLHKNLKDTLVASIQVQELKNELIEQTQKSLTTYEHRGISR